MYRSSACTLILAAALAGCVRTRAPVDTPSEAPERLRCDATAAQAIQAAAPEEARALAAEAAECYAALVPAT